MRATRVRRARVGHIRIRRGARGRLAASAGRARRRGMAVHPACRCARRPPGLDAPRSPEVAPPASLRPPHRHAPHHRTARDHAASRHSHPTPSGTTPATGACGRGACGRATGSRATSARGGADAAVPGAPGPDGAAAGMGEAGRSRRRHRRAARCRDTSSLARLPQRALIFAAVGGGYGWSGTRTITEPAPSLVVTSAAPSRSYVIASPCGIGGSAMVRGSAANAPATSSPGIGHSNADW